MKVNKLISNLYKAVIAGDKNKEKKIWFKILRKSLKHKKTQAVK
jgi:hypothetical protein